MTTKDKMKEEKHQLRRTELVAPSLYVLLILPMRITGSEKMDKDQNGKLFPDPTQCPKFALRCNLDETFTWSLRLQK